MCLGFSSEAIWAPKPPGVSLVFRGTVISWRSQGFSKFSCQEQGLIHKEMLPSHPPLRKWEFQEPVLVAESRDQHILLIWSQPDSKYNRKGRTFMFPSLFSFFLSLVFLYSPFILSVLFCTLTMSVESETEKIIDGYLVTPFNLLVIPINN